METIGMSLMPYTEQLAKFAGTVTSLQFLSGGFLINDIRKKGSSVGFPVGPFVGGIVLTLLSTKYGFLLRDEAMININIFGFIINTLYLLMFYWFTPNTNRFKLMSQIFYGVIFAIVCFLYAEYENKDLIEFRFGILLTGLLVMLVGSPLLNLKQIMRNQSTEGLPFPLILSGVIVSTSWMLYGFAILNNVLVVQNGFLLILGFIQLMLFVIYPSKAKTKKLSKKSD